MRFTVTKKPICLLLTLALLFALFAQPVRAASYITDPTSAKGSDYSPVYATKLDNLFQGKATLFTNTDETFPLGASLNNSKSYTVAKTYSGQQCYIYAQGVYYYLFGDVPRHGEGSAFWSDSATVMTNQTTAGYSAFLNAGVGFGAYLRTTINTDGSYNGNGHSMIVLRYDTTGIAYLEGNADGKGLVRITVRTWDEFNSNQLTSKGRRIGCIVQCKSAMCSHSFNNVGICSKCGAEYDHQASYDATTSGCYSVALKSGLYLRSQKPYSAAAASTVLIKQGTEVVVLGTVINAQGELWYQVSYNGATGYAPQSALTFLRYGDQEISCTVTSPKEGQIVPRESFPVIGTVSSKYPLKQIKAYLDGKLFATVDAKNATTVNLRATAVNYNLSFSTLATGKHILTLVVGDVHHEPETVCTRVFYTPSDAGDTDGDGVLTTDDAIYLLLYIMFGEEDYPLSADAVADLDTDGALTTDDAIYLLLHVMFGYEDYPLP